MCDGKTLMCHVVLYHHGSEISATPFRTCIEDAMNDLKRELAFYGKLDVEITDFETVWDFRK